MMILTNGFQKSGNHALVKACQLLGLPCSVSHLPYMPGALPGVTRHVFIVRDPRHVAMSMLRCQQQSITAGTFLARVRRFADRSLVDELAAYEGWLSDPLVHVVRYEALIANDTAIRGLAEYLGVPYLEDAWTSLPGLTPTWNAIHSDFRTIWTPQLEALWDAEGGNALLDRWGYARG